MRVIDSLLTPLNLNYEKDNSSFFPAYYNQ